MLLDQLYQDSEIALNRGRSKMRRRVGIRFQRLQWKIGGAQELTRWNEEDGSRNFKGGRRGFPHERWMVMVWWWWWGTCRILTSLSPNSKSFLATGANFPTATDKTAFIYVLCLLSSFCFLGWLLISVPSFVILFWFSVSIVPCSQNVMMPFLIKTNLSCFEFLNVTNMIHWKLAELSARWYWTNMLLCPRNIFASWKMFPEI